MMTNTFTTDIYDEDDQFYDENGEYIDDNGYDNNFDVDWAEFDADGNVTYTPMAPEIR